MANLPPRDAFGYFRTVETVYTVAASPTVQRIVGENPARVCLVISSVSGGVVTTLANAPAGSGIGISTSLQTLVLTQTEHGSLAQIAWYINGATAGAKITTLEVIVDNWPTPQGVFKDARQTVPLQGEQDDTDQ